MKLENFADYYLNDIYEILDEVEEKNPEVAEHLAMDMMLKISQCWQELRESNQKREKLIDIDNVN